MACSPQLACLKCKQLFQGADTPQQPITLLPCGHNCCEQCALDLDYCPACVVPVISRALNQDLLRSLAAYQHAHGAPSQPPQAGLQLQQAPPPPPPQQQQPVTATHPALQSLQLQGWLIPSEHLSFGALLSSEGNTCRVWRGTLRTTSSSSSSAQHVHVATKAMQLDLSASPSLDPTLESFQREMACMLNLTRVSCHPNLCTYYGVAQPGAGPAAGSVCIVMRLYPGSLSAKLQGGVRLPVAASLRYALGMLRGLEALHEQRILHLDIKPANVLLDEDDAAVLCDLGIARLAESTQSMAAAATTTVRGTFNFMPPEQFEGARIGTASDVWALACTLLNMLTGRKPFHGVQMAQIMRKVCCREVPPLPAGLPPPLASIMTRCFAFDPAQRPTVPHLINECQHLLNSIAAPPPSPPPAPDHPPASSTAPTSSTPLLGSMAMGYPVSTGSSQQSAPGTAAASQQQQQQQQVGVALVPSSRTNRTPSPSSRLAAPAPAAHAPPPGPAPAPASEEPPLVAALTAPAPHRRGAASSPDDSEPPLLAALTAPSPHRRATALHPLRASMPSSFPAPGGGPHADPIGHAQLPHGATTTRFAQVLSLSASAGAGAATAAAAACSQGANTTTRSAQGSPASARSGHHHADSAAAGPSQAQQTSSSSSSNGAASAAVQNSVSAGGGMGVVRSSVVGLPAGRVSSLPPLGGSSSGNGAVQPLTGLAATLADAGGPSDIDLQGRTLGGMLLSEQHLHVRRAGVTLSNGTLSLPEGCCLVVEAPGVTLLNLTITGAVGSPARGLVCVRARSATLRGCTVTVLPAGASSSTTSTSSSAPAPPGGGGGGGSGGGVVQLPAASAPAGVHVVSSGSAQLLQCSMSGALGCGVHVEGAVLVEGGVVSECRGAGLCAEGAGARLVAGKGCRAVGCERQGWLARSGGEAVLGEGCEASNCGGDGMLAHGAGSKLVAGPCCRATTNQGVGFHSADGAQLTAGDSCVASSNRKAGFASSGTGSRLSVGRTAVSRRNHGEGLVAQEGGELSCGDECLASGNKRAGWAALGSGTVVVGRACQAVGGSAAGFLVWSKPGCVAGGCRMVLGEACVAEANQGAGYRCGGPVGAELVLGQGCVAKGNTQGAVVRDECGQVLAAAEGGALVLEASSVTMPLSTVTTQTQALLTSPCR